MTRSCGRGQIFDHGVEKLKLFFMSGRPTDTDEIGGVRDLTLQMREPC